MHFRETSRRYLLVCLAAIFFAALPAFARVDKPHPAIDPHNVAASFQDGPADLSSAWLTHDGDDPRYADPHFDDSRWPVVKVGRHFRIVKVNGPQVVWYRTHAHVPAGSRNLGLLLRWFPGNWTIYVNGIPVGSAGVPPPRGFV